MFNPFSSQLPPQLALVIRPLALVAIGRQRPPQGRRGGKYRLAVRNHVIASVALGREQHEDRRRLIGDKVADRAGQERSEADAHRLDQRHTLDRWVADGVGALALIRPEPHLTRQRAPAFRKLEISLDPGGERDARRRDERRQGARAFRRATCGGYMIEFCQL
jgi:hypothetical protein